MSLRYVRYTNENNIQNTGEIKHKRIEIQKPQKKSLFKFCIFCGNFIKINTLFLN